MRTSRWYDRTALGKTARYDRIRTEFMLQQGLLTAPYTLNSSRPAVFSEIACLNTFVSIFPIEIFVISVTVSFPTALGRIFLQ
jgi:hypothetical protein